MSELTWDYPILMVIALVLGIVFYYFLTRSNRLPLPKEAERECARCKLIVRGNNTKDFRYCPFCGNKY